MMEAQYEIETHVRRLHEFNEFSQVAFEYTISKAVLTAF
jgi:hypothetical protein